MEINLASNVYTIYDLISFIMGLVCGTLSYKSRSTAITSIYPRFVIRAGETAAAVIKRLLSYVPDVIFFSGLTGYIVYPQESDSSVYDYYFPFNNAATEPLHYLQEGRYQVKGKGLNHIIVIGKDANDEIVVGDEQDSSDIASVGERLDYFYKPQLVSASDADAAAAAALGDERMAASTATSPHPPISASSRGMWSRSMMRWVIRTAARSGYRVLFCPTTPPRENMPSVSTSAGCRDKCSVR